MEAEENEKLNESTATLFNESVEFRGDLDSSFGSDIHSASFMDISDALRTKPDINIFYRTPCSGASRFSRRSSSVRLAVVDHFKKLPERLILRIFTYLNKTDLVNTMRTCRQFNQIARDFTLWKYMNVGKRAIDEPVLHSLLDRQVMSLRLAEAQIIAAPTLCWYNFHNTLLMARLTHLDLSQTIFSDKETLCRLLRRCRSLKALSLENCEIVDDEILREIAKNQELQHLDMVYVKRLSKIGICGLLCICRKLIELNLGWTEVEDDAISSICQFMPSTVRRLNMSGFREHPEMNNQNVSLLCKSCPHLEELDLSDNAVITEGAVEILRKLKRLRVLSLSRCNSIEPISFINLGHLQVLNIYGCIGVEGVELLRDRHPHTAINWSPADTIAKPTVGDSVTSIWGEKTRDLY